MQEVRRALEAPERPTLAEMRALLEGGVAVAPRATVERALAELQQLLTLAERWEEKARVCLQARWAWWSNLWSDETVPGEFYYIFSIPDHT